ncbi:transglutaminase family protein [Homoserinibacter sp. YIM 151385]|uniref:transglutaminase family protein n=1 Tax=Homoserinibacter sp. YIM 151385 TaxID=2985506 RepID=UPI0022F07E18|nr:DUF3488 and transglutaminase-like domain-containing protein [Homoserinibacter sp. YIM 151385]WBU39199.1 DUF3488 and transglutaminase-like domain-containing protein [Homoserinibacter sp. YIM 151385]
MAPAEPGAPRSTEPRPLLVSGLLALGIAASIGGLHVLLQGVGWWLQALVMVLAVLGAAAAVRGLLRDRERRRWLPPLAGALAGVAMLVLVFAPGTAILGVVPTPDTLEAMRQLVVRGGASIAEQRIPARADAGIALLIAGLAVFTAVWADITAIALRQRAIAAAPLALPMIVPLAIRSGIASVPIFLLVALVWLLLLRLGRPRRTRGDGAVLGATALVGALLVPVALPPVEPSGGGAATGLQTRVNPIIELGNDLRRAQAVRALTYTSSTGDGLYLRLATLDEFSGRAWTPVDVPRAEQRRVDEFTTPQGLEDSVRRAEFEAQISIEQIGGRWLPVPYPATSVDGLEGDWFFEPEGLSVRSSAAGADAQEYEVAFLEVLPSRRELLAAGRVVPRRLERLTELPDGIPSVIGATAREVADGLETHYEQALALQQFFTSGDFVYSEDTPVEDGYDGTGAQVIERFLEERSGYCVHFSSAMAVMARTLGIPARVAVGFQPGRELVVDGERRQVVSTHDFHAWPELYFDGIGWVRFEPTPSRGDVPDYAQPLPSDDPETPEDERTDEPSAAPEPSRDASGGPSDLPSDPAEEDPVAQGARAASLAPLLAVGALVLLVAIGLAPAAARAIRRERRRSTVLAGRGPVSLLWVELRESARDLGWLAPDSETVQELALRAGAVVADRAPLDELRRLVEAEAYARPGPREARAAVAALDGARRGISALGTAAERRRAVLWPASLMDRVTPARWRLRGDEEPESGDAGPPPAGPLRRLRGGG